MVKAAWGKKHTCPKCGKRFYDLGKKGPAVCIECEHSWVPEPILKAKQTYVAAPKPVAVAAKTPAKEASEASKASAPDNPEEATDSKDGDDSADQAAVKELEVEVEDDGDEKEAGVARDISLDDDKVDLAEVIDTKLEKGSSE